MNRKYFIAGTDTDVGKTLIATGILVKARQMGLSTAAVKPVAAGCHNTADGLRNDDALQLRVRDALLREGQFHISSTEFLGNRYLRLALMNPDTDETLIGQLLDRIEELARN